METNNNEVLEKENVQNENVVNTPNDGVQKSSNKNNLIIVISIFVVIAVIAGAVTLGMILFKSEEKKAVESITEKQAIVKMGEEIFDNAEKLAKKYEQINTTVEIDVNELAETFGEDIGEELLLAFKLENATKKDDVSGKVGIEINKDSLATIEFAKTDEIYGIRIKGTNEKFIAIENKDLQKMFEKFDIPDADMMPNKILTSKDFEKVKKADYEKILNKYLDTVAKSLEGKVTTENNVELKIGDSELKTKKRTIKLTEKAAADMLMAILEELKDDEKNVKLVMNDVKSVLELMEDNGYPVEDMYGITSKDLPEPKDIMEEIKSAYEEYKELYDETEFDDKEEALTISTYEYKGQTIATEFSVETGEKLVFKSFNGKDEFIISLEAFEDDEALGAFRLEGKKDDKEIDVEFVIESDENYDGKLEEVVKVVADGKKDGDNWEADIFIEADGMKVKLFKIKQEFIKKADNFIKLDKKNALIVNNASKEDIEEYVEECSENAEEMMEELMEKFPFLVQSGNVSTTPSYDYDDYDYDYDYDYSVPVYNYNNNVEQKIGLLSQAQAMYNKIDMDDTKAEVIQKLGNPDDTRKYDTSEFLTWNLDSNEYVELIEVHLYNGKVSEKNINLRSSEYDGILLGKELGTQLEDLDIAVLKVKEGMTLAEVKTILGNSCFESSKNEFGQTEYRWHDKKELHVDITFDENEKVLYVGFVW